MTHVLKMKNQKQITAWYYLRETLQYYFSVSAYVSFHMITVNKFEPYYVPSNHLKDL